jgi:CARDB
MFGYEDINLNLAYPAVYLFIAIIVIAGYSYFIYKFTIPPISTSKRIILITLRSLALITILFIFFEPVLSFTKKVILEPVNLIFIDNSRSIIIDDGSNRVENEKSIAESFLSNPISDNDEIYLFGDHIRELHEDSLNNLNFNDAVTNISQVFSSVKKDEKNYSTLTLITDGVITAGSNSIYSASNLGLPIFTIGIGDTTQVIDVSVKRVLSNNLLYAETPTTIEATIQNNGLSKKNVAVSLYEDNNLIEQKNVELSSSGIQNESFTYTPKSPGEKKLTVVVSKQKEEFTSANNRKTFYINVLSNKVRVLILAGSPSADLTFIKNVLREDDSFTIKSLTQISKDKFAEQESINFIDSADIFFLVGFPSFNTSQNLISKVVKRIAEERIPFFLTITNGIGFNKLKFFQPELPFTIRSDYSGFRKVQPQIFDDQKNNPIIQNNSSDVITAWNDLPPIYQPSYNFIAKPESKVIAKIKVNNVVLNSPLIISKSFNGKRSIAVLAADIWRWKLQTVRKDDNLFDSFILNSVKWLNASDTDKRVNIKSIKKNYSLGEVIEFTAQVYDESINPVSDAEVKLIISSQNDTYELDLQSIGNGLYEGQIKINEKGDYNFSGKVSLDGKEIGTDNGRFNVGELDVEMINPRMNFALLNLLANETNGEFAFANDYDHIIKKIKEINENSREEKIITSDVTLWSDEWLMVIAVLLFSLEWFLRKRAGML